MRKSLVKTTVAVGVAAVLTGLSQTASAAGFALIENSAHQMGNAFAGQTAAANDLSTIWSNPAGMTRFEGRHFTVGIHGVDTSAEFEGTGTAFSGTPGAFPIPGSDGGDAGGLSPIPNLYWVQQVNDGSTRFGLGITVPFGLETDYENDWVGRYHATDSELTVVNINPALAWQFTETFSFGIGASIQYANAKISQKVDSFNFCVGALTGLGDPTPQATCNANGLPGPANAATDSNSEVDADSWGMGFNLGIMFEPTKRTRIGAQYRSKVRQEFEGDVDFTLNPGIDFFALNAILADQNAEATIDLPASASIGVYHEFGNRIAVMADAMWTQWSELEELRIKFPDPTNSLFALGDSVTTLEWEDSWRYALGLDVPAGQSVMLRFGVAYDETPVKNAELQTPRVPDGDRTWYSVGLGWQIGKRSSIDFGFSYLDVDTPKINNTIPASGDTSNTSAPGYNINGEYDAGVMIGSIQYNRSFGLF
jgi:long-chain fatty acid transport protein